MAPRFLLEAHSLGATLYVLGPLTAGDLAALRLACSLLPGGVSTLRIDCGAAATLDASTGEVLKHVAADWRRTRAGSSRMPPWSPGVRSREPNSPITCVLQ